MKLTDKDIAAALEDSDFDDELEVAPASTSKYKKNHDFDTTMIPNRITKFRNGVEEKRDNKRTYGK